MATALNLARMKKKKAQEAREQVVIHEEEKITTRNVKTIMDGEVAEMDRKKMQSQR